tara:strand:+ start:10925 stop:11296 length:372 start_codon:yes stop_codon:yes gene_type:complete
MLILVLLFSNQILAASGKTCFVLDNDKGFSDVTYTLTSANKTTVISPNSNSQATLSMPVNEDGSPIFISLSAKADGLECTASQPRDKKYHEDTLYYYHLIPSHSSDPCKINLKIRLNENCSKL